jgi:hypothetical protein
MRNPQKITLILSILFFVSMAHAISIYSPEKVPAFTPFTFQATLPATENFTQAILTFDNLVVATIYPNGQCVVTPDWQPFVIHCTTFDADTKTTQGLTLVFTHTGFAKGTHDIVLQSQGTQSETQSVQLKVFEAVDSGFAADLNTGIVSIQSALTEMQTQSNQVQENTNAAQAEIGARVDDLQTQVANAKQTIDALQNEKAQAAANNDNGFQIPFGQPASPGTGFAFGVTAPIIGLGVLIVLIGLFFFTHRGRGGGMGAEPDMRSAGKQGFFDGNFDAIFKNAQSDSKLNDAQPRKFASLGGTTTTERDVREDLDTRQPGKISMGDLIRSDERD